LLQIWIIPDRKGVKPAYAEKSVASAAPGQFHLVTSKSGRNGSLAIHQDADLYFARLNSGQKLSHPLQNGRHAWVHVAEGTVVLDGETLRAGDAVAVSQEAAIGLRGVDAAQVLLFDLN